MARARKRGRANASRRALGPQQRSVALMLAFLAVLAALLLLLR